jgi:hypothetical protein
MKRILLFILLALVAVSFVLANETDNDPKTNPDANACYAGGVYAGKCGDNPNLWRAGWFKIRLDAGLILESQLPPDVRWIIDAKLEGCSEGQILVGLKCYPIPVKKDNCSFTSQFYSPVPNNDIQFDNCPD